MKLDILGVNIDKISLPDIVDQVLSWIKLDSQHYIATVNPEFVIEAQKNEKFKEILNRSGLAICDGVGLVWASVFLYGKKLIRVTGVDLVLELLKKKELKIFLLGGEEGIAERVKDKFPEANIVGVESGGKLSSDYILENNDIVIKKINNSGANVLLVAFGQVKQEMWAVKNLNKLLSVKVAIGVGGTFDYLSGQVKRAPKFVRKLGLEWFYRLLRQPSRIKRIYNAWIKFSWLVCWSKVMR